MRTGPAEACRTLVQRLQERGVKQRFPVWVREAHHRWLALSTPPSPSPSSRIRDPAALFASLRRLLPADTVTTCDAGSFARLVHRYLFWDRPDTFIGPMSGAMGFALPAAIGARISDPVRPAVAFAGDGGFLMTLSELATAVHRGIGRLVCIVFDDARYGAIARRLSDRGLDARGPTDLSRVDLATAARAFGARGSRPRTYQEFELAVSAGLDASRPTVIHVRLTESVQA